MLRTNSAGAKEREREINLKISGVEKSLKDGMRILKSENARKVEDVKKRITDLNRRTEIIERSFMEEVKKLSKEAENI